MTRWVNLGAVLLIVLGNFLFWPAIWPKPKPAPEPFEVKGKVYYREKQREPEQVPWIPLAMGAIGSVVLFVDAIRRPQGPSKAASYACTLAGVFMMGVPALFYYAMIGWRPVGETDQVYGRGFCRKCLASTTNESAGNTFTVNFLWGTRFLGGSNRCQACGSQVKTKWVCVGLPLIPQGSYRVILVSHGQYLSRKTGLDVKHVGIVYGITAGVVLAGLVVFALSVR